MAGKGPDRHLFRVAHGITLDAVEKEYILASLQRNGNNKARTAEMLGVSEKTLYNKLNRYGREAKAATDSTEGSDAPPPIPAVEASAQDR
jgi:DNA-binding NtrC family response regulator